MGFSHYRDVYTKLHGYGRIINTDYYEDGRGVLQVKYNNGSSELFSKYGIANKKCEQTDLEELFFKVGEEVISETYGKGYVEDIFSNSFEYTPILSVRFYRYKYNHYLFYGDGIEVDSYKEKNNIHHIYENGYKYSNTSDKAFHETVSMKLENVIEELKNIEKYIKEKRTCSKDKRYEYHVESVRNQLHEIDAELKDAIDYET